MRSLGKLLFITVLGSLNLNALTLEEFEKLVRTQFSSNSIVSDGVKIRYYIQNTYGVEIGRVMANNALKFYRENETQFQGEAQQVVNLINQAQGPVSSTPRRTPSPIRGARPSSPPLIPSASAQGGASGRRSPSPVHRSSPSFEDDDLQAALEISRITAEEEAQLRYAKAASLSGSGAFGRRSPSPVLQMSPSETWLNETFLISDGVGSIGGFDKVADRMAIFNPLYANNFPDAGPHHSKVFPNVPIVHQYNPAALPGGVFFPLVIKISPLFIAKLPPYIQIKPDNLELYWVVQTRSSINQTGGGAADNIVFRPQYWVQPSGAAIAFSAHVHVWDPQGQHVHLPLTGYSIHDGVASPNAPVIPFQAELKSGKSTRFWSLTTHGSRTALTCHWVLADQDIDGLNEVLKKSVTIKDLIIGLRKSRGYFESKMIEEIEQLFDSK